MPRGKYASHKGKHRHFTDPEELEAQRKKDEREKKWKKQDDSSEEEEEDDAKGPTAEESDEDDSDSDGEHKAKGVENLIEIENPNRVQKKNKKVSELGELVPEKTEMSRKEKEEMEKQRAKAYYQKLHAEGKTEAARADLARLAIIRKQREEAAKKRDEEKKVKDAHKAAKLEETNKALGKSVSKT